MTATYVSNEVVMNSDKASSFSEDHLCLNVKINKVKVQSIMLSIMFVNVKCAPGLFIKLAKPVMIANGESILTRPTRSANKETPMANESRVSKL